MQEPSVEDVGKEKEGLVLLFGNGGVQEIGVHNVANFGVSAAKADDEMGVCAVQEVHQPLVAMFGENEAPRRERQYGL